MSMPVVANTARPRRFAASIVKNARLSRRYFLLVLERPSAFEDVRPGMFIHLLPSVSGRFFLRRPFSVLDCDARTLSLIIVEKGPGTSLLRSMSEGTSIDFIGPLGSSFPPLPGRRILAVGGGVGLAPLYFYRATWGAASGSEFRLLYGARTKEDLFTDRFDWRFSDVGFATDDGSYGFAGNVVAFASREMEATRFDAMFSCGPMSMLRAAAKLALRRGIRHFVSLENRMACGMGACRSCVIPTLDGPAERYRTVCNDGPVFDADTLVWDRIPEA